MNREATMADNGEIHDEVSAHLPRPVRRVRRPREAAARTYDRLSRCYDTVAAAEQPYVDEGIAMLNAQPGESVLEIGFGTGRALVKLAESVGDEGKVSGIDISTEMVARAAQRLTGHDLDGHVELVEADAIRLPYRTARFDAIFMSFTLELFDTPEIPAVLSECLKVLRPPGRICVVSLSREGGPYPMRRIYEWVHELVPAFMDCRPIFAARALRRHGFLLKEVRHRRMWGLPVELVLAERPLGLRFDLSS